MDYTGVYENESGVAVTGLTGFCLDDILDCGQCFRWENISKGHWRGTAFGLCRELIQQDDILHIPGASMDEFSRVWHGYLDFGRDYSTVREILTKDPAMRLAVEFTPGMRVLRQEPWETLCSFIISQNNNIKRIKGIVSRLCELFGEKTAGGYTFPSPEALSFLAESDLAPLRCGFRAPYILDAARKVSSGEVDLAGINSLPDGEAAAELMKIRGVGPKVAACALLYGFGRAGILPVDVWIRRALDEFYPDGIPQEIKEVCGLGQQYLFHYYRLRNKSAN